LRTATGVSLAAFAAVTLGVLAGFYLWAPTVVERFDAIVAHTSDNTLLYDRHDQFVAAVEGAEDRRSVPLSGIAPELQKAVVAIEDRRFFAHRGMDPIRLGAAIWADLQSMAFQQGASTITQQLVKLTLLSPERTLGRKVREMFMALALEREYGKERILEFYLNQVYLGYGLYGVETASRAYFRKPASELTVAESAILAALIKKPEGYLSGARVIGHGPDATIGFPEDSALLERRAQVLLTLRQLGWITAEEYAAAKSEPPRMFKPRDEGRRAPYFVEEVLRQMRELLGVPRVSGRGFRVYTTLDTGMQQAAEELIGALKEARFAATQGALVALDPQSGEVRALVGGVEYADSQFNRASQAHRQPGSAFKPILYATALENGYRPDSIFLDEPVRYSLVKEDGTEEVYEPRNYGERYGVVQDDGNAILPLDKHMTLGRALETSSNVISVQLLRDLGYNRVIKQARKMGVEMRAKMGLCLALGCSEASLLDLTSAYAAFANGGFRARPVMVRRIENSEGRLLYERLPEQGEPVLSPWTAFQMNYLLQGVVQRGTGWRARLDRPVGGKTGTNDGPRDTWFVGFTPTLVAGVWTGNDDNRIMPYEAGGKTAASLWRTFMERVLEPYRGESFPQPEDAYVAVRVCTISGHAVGQYCPHSELYYFRTEEAPQIACDVHQGPPVAHATCVESGELIADLCPLEDRQFRLFYPNALPNKPCPVHTGEAALLAASARTESAQPPEDGALPEPASPAPTAQAPSSPLPPGRTAAAPPAYAQRLDRAFGERR
jgi:penicillin-binding protein 1A